MDSWNNYTKKKVIEKIGNKVYVKKNKVVSDKKEE
jgi:hypothetical protein